MCNWERFCTFARSPERRKVGIDARVTIEGVAYEVEPDLAGETVVLWWGLFDNELYVEHGERRYGPLTTPLQIEHYLRLCFENAYQAATKPVTVEMVEAVLAAGLNDLEPRLIRHGYSAKVIAKLLNIRESEVNSFLNAQLPPGRTEDLRNQMLKIGIPLYA